ncbi:hypothetical protein EDD85DRAFT_792039 [Armillaria nabsnona]|nr:hypothetical protein EDD85DRAFT_792039 [Armillaria nabsnona]
MSSIEAPESYLAILPLLSEQHYDELFDNSKFNPDERQTLGLLDPLAGICVSGRSTRRQWRPVLKRVQLASLGITKRSHRFQKLTNVIKDLYEVATFHTRDIETVVEVLATLSRSWKLSNPDTLAFIRGFDLLPTASDQADAPFPIERYLVLKTFNETGELKNGTLRQMNITDEDGRYLDRFVDDTGVQFEERYACCPHCESYKNAMFELPASYPYLFYGDFFVTGAHNTLYLPWVSPDLTSINPDIHAVVQKTG